MWHVEFKNRQSCYIHVRQIVPIVLDFMLHLTGVAFIDYERILIKMIGPLLSSV